MDRFGISDKLVYPINTITINVKSLIAGSVKKKILNLTKKPLFS